MKCLFLIFQNEILFTFAATWCSDNRNEKGKRLNAAAVPATVSFANRFFLRHCPSKGDGKAKNLKQARRPAMQI